MAGNVREAVPSGLCPRLENGVEKVAFSDAKTRSNNPSTVTDTPSAGPFTAAISGLGKSMNADTYSLLIKNAENFNIATKNICC